MIGVGVAIGVGVGIGVGNGEAVEVQSREFMGGGGLRQWGEVSFMGGGGLRQWGEVSFMGGGELCWDLLAVRAVRGISPLETRSYTSPERPCQT